MSFDSKRHYNDKRAANYDVIIRKAIPGYATLHDISRVLLETEVGDTAELLIAGCGTGTELGLYADECPGWHFTGVDPSAGMLDIARDRINHMDRIKLVEGYVSDLPNKPTFDAATLILVMHFLSDDENAPGGGKAGVLSQIAQRLKPGAPLIFGRHACRNHR